ncbi:MAG: exodeoxyribonuclease VII small subunit [Acidimicrobiales bacterium]
MADEADRPGAGRPGYAKALAELETILAELEDDHIDVDALGAKVKRAAALIELCRSRIEAARIEVNRVIAPSEPTAPPTENTD